MSKTNGHRRTVPRRTPRPVGTANPDVAMLESLKKTFLDRIQEGTHSLSSAAAVIQKSPSTVWRWRVADSEFDKAVVAAYQTADSVRATLVEDTLFRRLVEGKASPVEMIFYLKNRAPDRWRDVNRTEVTGANGGPLAHKDVTDARDELTSRIARIAVRSQPSRAPSDN